MSAVYPAAPESAAYTGDKRSCLRSKVGTAKFSLHDAGQRQEKLESWPRIGMECEIPQNTEDALLL